MPLDIRGAIGVVLVALSVLATGCRKHRVLPRRAPTIAGVVVSSSISAIAVVGRGTPSAVFAPYSLAESVEPTVTVVAEGIARGVELRRSPQTIGESFGGLRQRVVAEPFAAGARLHARVRTFGDRT